MLSVTGSWSSKADEVERGEQFLDGFDWFTLSGEIWRDERPPSSFERSSII